MCVYTIHDHHHDDVRMPKTFSCQFPVLTGYRDHHCLLFLIHVVMDIYTSWKWISYDLSINHLHLKICDNVKLKIVTGHGGQSDKYVSIQMVFEWFDPPLNLTFLFINAAFKRLIRIILIPTIGLHFSRWWTDKRDEMIL